MLSPVHTEHWPVSPSVAVDCVIVMEIVHLFVVAVVLSGIAIKPLDVVIPVPTAVFVEKPELGDEFTIHVGGRAVWTGHAASSNDKGADQAGVNIPAFVHVRVVNPKGGAAVAFRRTCAFRNFPQISVDAARSYGIVCFVLTAGSILISSTFGVLAI